MCLEPMPTAVVLHAVMVPGRKSRLEIVIDAEVPASMTMGKESVSHQSMAESRGTAAIKDLKLQEADAAHFLERSEESCKR